MAFWEPQAGLTLLQWFARTVTVFFWLLLITKLIGQRQIGRLTLFDFVISISIGTVASGPLTTSSQGLVSTLTNVATLGGLDILLAFLALKYSKLRRVVQEEPLVLIQNGQVLEDTMRKARFNLSDLLLELRQKNYANMADVEFAILESNGKLSVIPKSQARPLRPTDLSLSTVYEGMPTVLVEDGNVVEDNLRENGLTRDWLAEELKKQGVGDFNSVLAAMLDTQGRLYVSKKNQTNEEWIH